MTLTTCTRKFIAFVLFTAVISLTLYMVSPLPVRASTTYSGGSGTSADPYQISTADEWTTLMNTSTDWSKYFVLTSDIDFDGATLTPVGSSSSYFSGSFNGYGHVLSNAIIDGTGYVGVFGAVWKSNISNLGIKGINVNASSMYVGGLIGINDRATITNCYATGTVTSLSSSRVGGLIGYNTGGTVTSCYATGTVTAKNDAGGLIGWNTGTVTNCYATGEVSGVSDIGGLIGYNSTGSTVTNCYATGRVHNVTIYYGGLIGYDYDATVENCYWDTETSGQTTSDGGIGCTTNDMTYEYATDVFVDWDFTDTWVADELYYNSGYPYLSWQSFSPVISVTGNSETIDNGDSTPSEEDDTDFGSVDINSGSVTHTFTILNTGTAYLNVTGVEIDTGDFTVSASPSATVADGSSTDFSVTFTPSAVGLRTATVSITSNDTSNNTYTFAIQGTGTSPEIDVQGNGTSVASGDDTPSTTDDTYFGSADITGGSVTHTFTISNTGNAKLIISGIVIDNTYDFLVTTPPASAVEVGDNTTLVVEFDPSTMGTRSAKVTITNNDIDEGNYYFYIQGTGTNPYPEIDIKGKGNSIANGSTEISTDIDTDFGSADITSGRVTHSFTICNTGTAVLTLTDISVDDTDFTIDTTDTASTVAVGGYTTFAITFNPSAAGTGTATVTITSDDADESSYYFTIQGTGTPYPEIDIQGDTSFGCVNVDSGTAERTFTIYNTGSADLEVTGWTVNNTDFTITTPPASLVVAGDNTTFTVTFNPSAVGSVVAVISIASNDASEGIYTFTVQGTGKMSSSGDSSGTYIYPTTITTTTATPGKLEISVADRTSTATGTSTINMEGVVSGELTISSPDEVITVTIPDSTTVLTGDNTPPDVITITPDEIIPAPPTDSNVIGVPYECLPDGTTFNPPITLVWSYDPLTLPEGTDESQLQIAFYNAVTGAWETVECVVDTVNHTITAAISHFSNYAVFAPAVETKPAVSTTTAVTITTRPIVTTTPVATTTKTTVPATSTPTNVTTNTVSTTSSSNTGLIWWVIIAVLVAVIVIFIVVRRKKNSQQS